MSQEEDHVISALVGLCKQLDVRCAVQIGAFDGSEVAAIQVATGCHAIAIEGNSLCKPISSDIEWHNVVIGATDGSTVFYLHPTHELSGQFPRGDGGELAISCEQMRLDTFCRERNLEPDALIIDTEGTGLDVLEGCGLLLDNVKLVYIELQNAVLRPGIRLRKETETLLEAHGLTEHKGLPSYDVGGQGNYTWTR